MTEREKTCLLFGMCMGAIMTMILVAAVRIFLW